MMWTLAQAFEALRARGLDCALQGDAQLSFARVHTDTRTLQAGDLFVALRGERFAVSYRNSIYGTMAEERYAVLPDRRYRLVEIAADQLAVLEEYYAVPDAPSPSRSCRIAPRMR